MADKFDTMVAMLERDPQLAEQFGKNPDTVLKQFGVEAGQHGNKGTAAALERANAVLKATALIQKTAR
jgi:hypothetical protein